MSSSSSSSTNQRNQPVGVPDKCWCKNETKPTTSRTEKNPGRRFFRCELALAKKLSNDSHCFKWVDEALLDENVKRKDEIESMRAEIETVKAENQKLLMMVDGICEKFEYALMDVNAKMKKMIIGIVVFCVICVCVAKFI